MYIYMYMYLIYSLSYNNEAQLINEPIRGYKKLMQGGIKNAWTVILRI